MLQNRLLRCLLVLPFCCAFLLTGCGKKGVTVKGTVILPQGTTLAETDATTVTFRPEEAGGMPSSAKIKADGSFVATKVYPGKSKISLSLEPYPGSTPEILKRKEAFRGLNKTFDANNSPLTYEVTSDPEQTITIDLPQKKVTKQ